MRLYLLHLGMMQPGDVPVPGYLVRTTDGINILIDTGWPDPSSKLPETRLAFSQNWTGGYGGRSPRPSDFSLPTLTISYAPILMRTIPATTICSPALNASSSGSTMNRLKVAIPGFRPTGGVGSSVASVSSHRR